MRLFKRRKSEDMQLCPRCGQVVEKSDPECPLCGWDVREAYRPADDRDRRSSTA